MSDLETKLIEALKDSLIRTKTDLNRQVMGMRHEQAMIHATTAVESGIREIKHAHYAQETRTSEEPVVNNGVTATDESKQ